MSWQEYESRKAARRSGRSILQRGLGDAKDYCTPAERRAVAELAADPVIAAPFKAHGDLKAPRNIVESQKRMRTVSWQEHHQLMERVAILEAFCDALVGEVRPARKFGRTARSNGRLKRDVNADTGSSTGGEEA